MRSRKRGLAYVLIALLLLILLAVIIRLLYIVLNFRFETPPPIEQPPPAARLHTTTPGPVSEVLIQIEAEPEAPAAGEPAKEPRQDAAVAAGHGSIPSICEGYGPQIRSRVTFPNPLTHQAAFSPNRVTVVLDIKPESP